MVVSAHNQTHDLDVQYSTIDHNLMVCDEKLQVQMTENNYNNGKMCVHIILYTLWVKLKGAY